MAPPVRRISKLTVTQSGKLLQTYVSVHMYQIPNEITPPPESKFPIIWNAFNSSL